MARFISLCVVVFIIGRLSLASRKHLKEDANELDLVVGPNFEAGPMVPLLSGLSKLQPFCGSRLLANIIIYKPIGSNAFTVKKGGGVILSSGAFRDDFASHSVLKGPIPVLPGMSLYTVGIADMMFANAWADERQAIDFINKQIEAYGWVELSFDAGLDIRSCWNAMYDVNGRQVCGDAVMSDLVRALETFPPLEPNNLGKSGATVISNYPYFVFKSLSEERALLTQAMPNISSALTQLQRAFGGAYATGLSPMCAVVPAFDGTDWLVMRKVEVAGARPINVNGVPYLDLKGPKFVGMRDGKTFVDNTFWGGLVAKYKDPGFASTFPAGLTVSNCGGREFAFSMEKDAELLETLAMTDYSLLVKFYEADLNMQECDKRHRVPTFPIILDVVKPIRFRIALGIIDYIEQTTNWWLPGSTLKTPDTYHEYWMHMWPNYFHLSGMSLPEYRNELFLKRVRGFEVSKVVALTRLKWASTQTTNRKWAISYFRDLILEPNSADFSTGFAYMVSPGELGQVEGEVEDGLLVHWDTYKGALFWVAPQEVMPVPR